MKRALRGLGAFFAVSAVLGSLLVGVPTLLGAHGEDWDAVCSLVGVVIGGVAWCAAIYAEDPW